MGTRRRPASSCWLPPSAGSGCKRLRTARPPGSRETEREREGAGEAANSDQHPAEGGWGGRVRRSEKLSHSFAHAQADAHAHGREVQDTSELRLKLLKILPSYVRTTRDAGSKVLKKQQNTHTELVTDIETIPGSSHMVPRFVRYSAMCVDGSSASVGQFVSVRRG